jgi:hypothetical protein
MQGELERIGKEAAIACLKVLSSMDPGTRKMFSIRIIPASTVYFPRKKN